MLLFHTVHEEDLVVHHDHLHKVVVEEMQVPYKEGDEAMEDDAEVDGSVVAKEEQVTLRRPNLAHSVIAVASMDTMPHSVLKEQAHPAVAILHSLSTSAAILRRFVVKEEEQEETGEVDEGLVFLALTSFMTSKGTSTLLMKTAISFSSLLKKMMLPPRSKPKKNRETESNQYRYGQ